MDRLYDLVKNTEDDLLKKLYQKQVKKMEALIQKPPRIEEDIALVSAGEGIHGVQELVAELEVRTRLYSLVKHAADAV